MQRGLRAGAVEFIESVALEGFANMDRGGNSGGVKLPRPAKVKSKQAADRQITAEQLIREAKDRREDERSAPPRQKIVDQEVSKRILLECSCCIFSHSGLEY